MMNSVYLEVVFKSLNERRMLSYMIHQISDSSDHSLLPVFHIDDFPLYQYDCIELYRIDEKHTA